MNEYYTVSKPGIGEIEEKKSRFICYICYVETEEHAMEILEGIRKKHWDARHHCYAYVLGEKNELARCSDDGEPAQTAGKPILTVLTQKGLTNIMAVVVRYFGGTLLGTGGLVRAYTEATQKGLAHTKLMRRFPAKEMRITTDYTGLGKIQYIFANEGLMPIETTYTEEVKLTFVLPMDKLKMMEDKVIEATSGKGQYEWGEAFYAEEPCL